jgi:large repetitive protein
MSPSTRRTALLLALGIALGAGGTVVLTRALGGKEPPGAKGLAARAAARGAAAKGAEAGVQPAATTRRSLEGDCVLAGSIRKADGSPLPGATVHLRLLDEPWATAEIPKVVATGADGAFAFPGMTRDASYQLWAYAEGFSVESFENAVCGAATDLVLEPGGGVAFRFSDASGEPVGPVDVQIAGDSLWPARAARSTPEGRLDVVGLSPGFYVIQADAGERALAYLSDEPFEVVAGPPREIAIRLLPSAPATVRVVDAATGAPVQGAVATIGPATASMLERVAAVDAAGAAVFSGLLRADHVVAALAPGYARSEPRSIGPGQEIAVRLDKGFSARGAVRTQDGAPIAGATIAADLELGDALTAISGTRQRRFLENVLRAASNGWPRLVPAAGGGTALAGPSQLPVPDLPAVAATGWRPTDANGRFAVDGLPAGRVVLTASHPEYVTSTAAAMSLSPGAPIPDVEIVMQPGTAISVRTLGTAGYPIRGAEVTVYDASEELLGEATTGTDGFAELKGLPGRFRVVASADGAVPAAATVQGRQGERLQIAMTLPAADQILRGRVVDERGYGVPETAITARALGRNLAQVILGNTAADGTFALEGAGAGSYHVTAEVGGAIRAQVVGATSAAEITLVLGQPIARVTTIGNDTIIEPQAGGPQLVEPGAGSPFGEGEGETAAAEDGSGDSLGVVAITQREESPDAPGGGTAGSSYSAEYGQTDRLTVTGPSASGPGGLPIAVSNGKGGVFVRAVQPGSEVAGAGLVAGDRIIAVDGAPVKNAQQAKAAIAGRVGTVVMLEVVHEGERLNVVVQRVRVSQ